MLKLIAVLAYAKFKKWGTQIMILLIQEFDKGNKILDSLGIFL